MDWHQRYARFPRPFGEEPTPFVREVFERPGDFGVCRGKMRILCPGDGYGRNGLWLARHGHSVVGVDLVPSAVASALAAAQSNGDDYVAIPADVSGSPFPLERQSRFDAIVSAWLRLPDERSRREWNSECWRRLRPDGWIVIIGGRQIAESVLEMSEWPEAVAWVDYSTEAEVRLVGQKKAPPPEGRDAFP